MNLPSLLWLSEISGAIHVVLLGLTAGKQADEMQLNFNFFKIHYALKQSTFHCICTKVVFFFSGKMYRKTVF